MGFSNSRSYMLQWPMTYFVVFASLVYPVALAFVALSSSSSSSSHACKYHHQNLFLFHSWRRLKTTPLHATYPPAFLPDGFIIDGDPDTNVGDQVGKIVPKKSPKEKN